MIQLTILLTRHHRLLSVAAMIDVFETANLFSQQTGTGPAFQISLVNPDHSVANRYPDYQVCPMNTLPKQDVILIPAFATDNLLPAIQINGDCLAWLVGQHQQGAEIAAFCTGAFLLAASGLLKNKPATTHIQAALALARAFPDIRLEAGNLYTQESGIYTGGGAVNGFYLMLRLVEKHCGRPLTIRVAKYFGIDLDREQQTYFGTFEPVNNHQDESVRTLQGLIMRNFQAAEPLDKLMAEVPASRRNLVRRFKLATGLTPIEYMQQTRIEAAKQLLESSQESITAIMTQSGYHDLKSFRSVFQKYTGMSPRQYKAKFCTFPVNESPLN